MSGRIDEFSWLADLKRDWNDRPAAPTGTAERSGSGPAIEHTVHVCLGRHCQRRGSRSLATALAEQVADAGLAETCPVVRVACRDRCDDAPTVDIYPGPVRYNRVTADDVPELVRRHLVEGDVIDRLLRHPRDGPSPWERDRVLSRREQRRLEQRQGGPSS
jgi:(2Fe-2S) ferredoxin